MDAWRVVLVRPGLESAGFGALGVSAVWPRWVERRMHRGAVVDDVRSMAPGYLFVRFGEGAVEWHRVAAACGEGFRGFIGGEFPAGVSDQVMEEFLGRCLDGGGLMAAPSGDGAALRVYRAGEVVRLVGVLGAMSGVVSWSDEHGVRVTTTLFNRATEMWLPRGAIEGDTANVGRRARSRRSRRRVSRNNLHEMMN